MRSPIAPAAAGILFASLLAVPPAFSDEGMWTLDNLPLKELQERYGFAPTPDWIEHVRLGAVRFNDGGSGGFVSPNGLVVTNHHVAMGQLQKVSSKGKDFVKSGFFAKTRSDELRCPDLELNVLVSAQDVTARVLGTIRAADPAKIQNEQRKAAMARIAKESNDRTGLRSDVVELYQGGEYWLYCYKKYTDVRLVAAPEHQAAFHGGDLDNFTFPRHDLDFAFFRVYENDGPVRSTSYFHWHAAGAKEGELVFVAGHPGSTNRQLTIKQLEYRRDYQFPTFVEQLELWNRAYMDYEALGQEQSRRVTDRLRAISNELKRVKGQLDALRSPALMAAKAGMEKDLRARIARDPKLASTAAAWDRIALTQREKARRLREEFYRGLFPSTLAPLAMQIVQYVAEVEKENEKRYEEYRDSALESLKFRLFSPAPIYPDLEEHLLAMVLQTSLEKLGPKDPHVMAALEGRSPKEEAHRLVTGTKVADVEFRKQLIAGGVKAVESSDDPLIVWARKLDPIARELRRWREDKIQSVEKLEGGRIARARFEVFGKHVYPDATFTLRLSYGKVAGYSEGTTRVPCKTTFAGLYDRAASFDNQPPFDLAPLVEKHRDDIDLSTPVDFVSTDDSVGGSSGSPVLNRDAEVVGLHFDGNIQALARDVVYSDEQGRSINVHAGGILEALRKIYRMDSLADELTVTQPVSTTQ